jgi:hypothetical protein
MKKSIVNLLVMAFIMSGAILSAQTEKTLGWIND